MANEWWVTGYVIQDIIILVLLLLRSSLDWFFFWHLFCRLSIVSNLQTRADPCSLFFVMVKMTGRVHVGVRAPTHNLLHLRYLRSPTCPLEIAGNEQQETFANVFGHGISGSCLSSCRSPSWSCAYKPFTVCEPPEKNVQGFNIQKTTNRNGCTQTHVNKSGARRQYTRAQNTNTNIHAHTASCSQRARTWIPRQNNSSTSQICLPSNLWLMFLVLLVNISPNSCRGAFVNTRFQRKPRPAHFYSRVQTLSIV